MWADVVDDDVETTCSNLSSDAEAEIAEPVLSAPEAEQATLPPIAGVLGTKEIEAEFTPQDMWRTEGRPKDIHIKEARGKISVAWFCPSSKLKGKESSIISPSFNLETPWRVSRDGSVTQEASFKFMLTPKVCYRKGKGGACFKTSEGKGSVGIVCGSSILSDTANVTTSRIMIASKDKEGRASTSGSWLATDARSGGPHDFRSHNVFELPNKSGDWNFSKYVDKKESEMFLVIWEVQF
jgi:hypothetical protein